MCLNILAKSQIEPLKTKLRNFDLGQANVKQFQTKIEPKLVDIQLLVEKTRPQWTRYSYGGANKCRSA